LGCGALKSIEPRFSFDLLSSFAAEKSIELLRLSLDILLSVAKENG